MATNQQSSLSTFQTNLFTWNSETKTFSTEFSTLAANASSVFGTIDDNAWESGFIIQSTKTGNCLTFAIVDVINKDEDGHVIILKATTMDFTCVVSA